MRMAFVSHEPAIRIAGIVRSAAWQSQSRHDGSDEACFHFRIGAVGVSIRSDCTSALEDFRNLYRKQELPSAPADGIEIEVVQRRSRTLLGKRFDIIADGDRRFVVADERAVLPHIEWAINWQIMLYLPRFFEVHAGVVEHGGVCTMFPATPGSGKSTLTASLLSRGWRYLSDEFALIDPDTLHVHPYPKAICLKEGSFQFLEKLGLERQGRPVYLKGKKGEVTFVRPDEFGEHTVGNQCPVRNIVFCRHEAGRRPNMTPISQAEAVLRLTQFSFNFVKFRARGVELLTRLVRQARCFELVSGPLEETRDLVADTVRNESNER